MKPFLSLLTSLLVTLSFSQQKLIAVKGNVTDAITTTLTDAIALAQPDDKIYLPGGYFSHTATIDKPVHIIGTGFQDGMNITGKTTINGNLTLSDLANGSKFEGFYLTDWFYSTTSISNITIKRCNMLGTAPAIGGATWNNTSIVNCVAREYVNLGELSYGVYGQNNTISNSFINRLVLAQYSTIKNCIIPGFVESCDNLTIQNNIFGKTSDCELVFGCSNITMEKNLVPILCTGYAGLGVISLVNPIAYNTSSAVFVDAPNFTFSPSSNFQLISASSGNNAGTDGTDIGIFGGSNPWKIGSLPIIPNIEQNNSYLDVQNQTFKLNVKVVPQTH
jgi:hypothetical protein